MRGDDELIGAWAAGERAAFDELVERHRPAVWRFFRRRSVESGTAEELTQDTFVQLLDAARRYEPRGVFRSYLFGIASRTLAGWRRREKHRPSQPTDGIEPAADASDPASVLWVRQALSALDDKDREVLMLREYEQLRYEEIATLLGVPVNTVRSRLFRARMALKARLNGEGGRHGDQT